MHFKTIVNCVFIGAVLSAATPSTDDSVTHALERRDDDCYQKCLSAMASRYSPDGLARYCASFCAALGLWPY